MKKPQVSPNAAHAGTVAVLAAAAELGAEALSQCLGSDEIASTMGGQTDHATTSDLQEALVARLAVKLGI